jgi:hypothetical protein
MVSGEKRGQKVEDKGHALRGDQKIDHRSNYYQDQQQPQLRIDLAHIASRG